MEDFSAQLLDGRLVFGKYPTQEEANLIVSSGFSHIVNLCTKKEITWQPYQIESTKITIKEYPFEDGRSQTPSLGWPTFEPFLQELVYILVNPENKLYLHCLGGHGRSGFIAAIVYGQIKQLSCEDALAAVYHAHQQRKVMADKWRKLGSPQRKKQKDLVRKYLVNKH